MFITAVTLITKNTAVTALKLVELVLRPSGSFFVIYQNVEIDPL